MSKNNIFKFFGAWEGNDIEEMLELVYQNRSDILDSANKLEKEMDASRPNLHTQHRKGQEID